MKPKKLIISALLTAGLLTSLVSAIEQQQLNFAKGTENHLYDVDPDPWILVPRQKSSSDFMVLNTSQAAPSKLGNIHTDNDVDPDPWI